MLGRIDVVSIAANDCMKELYTLAQPAVSWDEFIEENKVYTKAYKDWEKYNTTRRNKDKFPEEWKIQSNLHPDWENKSITECIGPRPYEFYYLPREVLNEIANSYVRAYKLDSQQELLDTITTLKNYCKDPIVDKWIPGENGFPGHRGYDHPNNLKEEIKRTFTQEILPQIAEEYNKRFNLNSEGIESSVSSAYAEIFQNKFFKFLDMAGKFYNWNRELNGFNTAVYLGASPNSNKEAVIENWKKYRNKDIEIDESKYKEEEEDDE